MAEIIVSGHLELSSLTQAEENILALTLAGLPRWSSTIWNSTLGVKRYWDGSAFATITAGQGETGAFGINLDGSLAITIEVASYGILIVPFAHTITGWEIEEMSDPPIPCTIVMDVYKDTYANYPPTVVDTITGSEKPTLTAAIKNTDLTLTTWTTAGAAGSMYRFAVDSNDLAEKLSLTIFMIKT